MSVEAKIKQYIDAERIPQKTLSAQTGIAVKDNSDNISVASVRMFTVDVTPPELNVKTPVPDFITDNPVLTVSGEVRDLNSPVITVAVALNGTEQGAIPVADIGPFKQALTLGEGENTITVTATNMAGRISEVTRSVTLFKQRRPGAYYNAIDLNRVEAAVKHISQRLREHAYRNAVRLRSEAWTVADAPTASDMERYLGNVRALVNAYHVLPETPPLPEGMDNLDYTGADAIEKALIDIDYLLDLMTAGANRYSGEFYLGEDDF